MEYDTALAQSSAIATSKIGRIRLRIGYLNHPIFQIRRFLFVPEYWKKWLGEKRFAPNVGVIAETGAYFKGFNEIYFSDGLYKISISSD